MIPRTIETMVGIILMGIIKVSIVGIVTQQIIIFWVKGVIL